MRTLIFAGLWETGNLRAPVTLGLIRFADRRPRRDEEARTEQANGAATSPPLEAAASGVRPNVGRSLSDSTRARGADVNTSPDRRPVITWFADDDLDVMWPDAHAHRAARRFRPAGNPAPSRPALGPPRWPR